MKHSSHRRLLVRPLATALTGSVLLAAGVGAIHAAETLPARVYWGDTHVHTSLSADSFAFGDTNLGPEAAYRYALGETIEMVAGTEVRIDRPLDFLAVADHSDGMGVLNDMAEAAGPAFLTRESGQAWFEKLAPVIGSSGVQDGDELYRLFGADLPQAVNAATEKSRYQSKAFQREIWSRILEAAEAYNQPGKFTTFAGYEWTSGKTGTMLHRVVLFEDGPDRTSQILPLTVTESDDPEKLWEHMAAYKRLTGGDVLAIPHNANMSNGRMFLPLRENGEPFDRAYAAMRQQMEPLVEVVQIKGDGETHPLISPRDEFADFETWHLTDSDVRYEYARSALKLGLQLQSQLGVNPYRFGMIGSTDTHTSMTAIQESAFLSKFTSTRPSPERITNPPHFPALATKWSAAGLAAVWSTGNTRAEIFSAMKRREVYATSGPRITLRFFGGWDYGQNLLRSSDWLDQAYAGGVPMGGELVWHGGTSAPHFLVLASKDPAGSGLERVQLVKGWLSADGETHEAVYDLAVADAASLKGISAATADAEQGRADAAAERARLLGAGELSAWWVDPDFNPAQLAFYYIRVLEVPSPRWSTYDAERYGFAPPSDVPAAIRERAYSSPIWYQPAPVGNTP